MNKSKNNSPSAVIYARVSHAKQVTEGHGIDSQTTRCREFADRKGYNVVSVFTDDMTGRVETRPGMETMLRFLKKKKNNTHIVLIDDISRLARNVRAHWNIRDDIASVGATLESPSIEFGDSSDSQLVENMLASVSQHHSQKNGETSFNRMRSRLLGGYWVFTAPIGYRYEEIDGHGKLLVKDEPFASIIKEGLEGFASGRFASQGELARFFESKPAFMSVNSSEHVLIQKITDLLSRPVYAGCISYMKSRSGVEWNVPFRKGKHEPIIDLETYEKIQERLSGKTKAATRKDANLDFPLRGSVLCEDCGKPLTANWSKGRRKSYAYYLCQKRGCPSKGKSIPKHLLEDQFAELLRDLEPSTELMVTAEAMFKDAWEEKRRSIQADQNVYRKEIKDTGKKIDGFIDMIASASSPATAELYERKIEELLRKKEVLAQKSTKLGESQPAFDDVFEPSIRFLGNPYKIWKNSDFAWKRAVLRLVFSESLTYRKNEGYRTPKTTIPFRVLADIDVGKSKMVPPHGLEPRTY
jgi:site-specific DNA recombinase